MEGDGNGSWGGARQSHVDPYDESLSEMNFVFDSDPNSQSIPALTPMVLTSPYPFPQTPQGLDDQPPNQMPAVNEPPLPTFPSSSNNNNQQQPICISDDEEPSLNPVPLSSYDQAQPNTYIPDNNDEHSLVQFPESVDYCEQPIEMPAVNPDLPAFPESIDMQMQEPVPDNSGTEDFVTNSQNVSNAAEWNVSHLHGAPPRFFGEGSHNVSHHWSQNVSNTVYWNDAPQFFGEGGSSSANPNQEIVGNDMQFPMGPVNVSNDVDWNANNLQGAIPQFFGEGGRHVENAMQYQMGPRRRITTSCTCQIVREVEFTNGESMVLLEIHGKNGIISHAIEEVRLYCFTNKSSAIERLFKNQTRDFSKDTLEEVRLFLTEYCEKKLAEGYRMMGGFGPDEWDDVMSYHEEFIPDDFNVGDLVIDDLLPEEPAGQNSKEKAPIDLSHQREKTRTMTLDVLRAHYHLTIEEAAEKLEISGTALKTICRKYKMGRWPYRRINSLQKQIDVLKPQLNSIVDEVRANAKAKIEEYEVEITSIYNDNFGFPIS